MAAFANRKRTSLPTPAELALTAMVVSPDGANGVLHPLLYQCPVRIGCDLTATDSDKLW
jgi:hypothetical protein